MGKSAARAAIVAVVSLGVVGFLPIVWRDAPRASIQPGSAAMSMSGDAPRASIQPGSAAMSMSADSGPVATFTGMSMSADTGPVPTFTEVTAARARVLLAQPLAPDRARTLIDRVDEDVAAVEGAFLRSFARTPTIYAFASSEQLAAALRDHFRYSPEASARLAHSFEGVFLPERGVIALDLGRAMRRHPFTLLRHELTHAMLLEVLGPVRARVPAWFDEGLARLAERSVAGGALIAARDRSRLFVMAARGTLPSLAELESREVWSSGGAAEVEARYVVSASAVELIEREVGQDGMPRLLSLMRAGRTFADAYEIVVGRSLTEFALAFPSLVEKLGPFPAIVVATEDRYEQTEDRYEHWMASGMPPTSALSVRISGTGYALEYVAYADRDGTYVGTFGGTAPPGLYLLEVIAANGSARSWLRSR